MGYRNGFENAKKANFEIRQIKPITNSEKSEKNTAELRRVRGKEWAQNWVGIQQNIEAHDYRAR